MSKNKRYVFIIIITIAILLGAFRNKSILKKSSDDIKIFVATDIHYFPGSLTDNSEGFVDFATPRDGKQMRYTDDMIDAFISDIKRESPDILVISGDLTVNGEKDGHIALTKKLKSIEKLGTKVLVVPGNHDILSMWARGYKNSTACQVDTIDQEEFKNIYKKYAYDEALLKDESSLSYLAAPSEDLWFLMIDSNKYFSGSQGMPTNEGYISDETLEWIKECGTFAKEKNAKIIAVMHHNILPRRETMSKGNVIENSMEVIDLFKELEINLVLSGHIHLQDIRHTDDEDYPIYEIITSSFSVYPQQYGVIEYNNTLGLKYNTQKIKVEEWAKENNIKDENLINFDNYSMEAFGLRTYNRVIDELELLGENTEEEIIAMAKLVTLINLRYFEGNILKYKEEIINNPTYELLIETNSDYVYNFVYSMIHGPVMDGTYLDL